MAKFRFEHRDGLALESDGHGRAVLRWRGASGTVLSVEELRWLTITAGPAALHALKPPAPEPPATPAAPAGDPVQPSLLDP